MRINVIVVSISLVLWIGAFSQVSDFNFYQAAGTEERERYDNFSNKTMGFWVLPYTGAGSPWARIPGNTYRYQRSHYLVRASEIFASGFPSESLVDAIGFYIGEAGVGTQTGNLRIYMKNTTDVTNTIGSTWDITGFTLVCDIASWTVPVDLGPYTIPFSGGSPFTYTGDGVYVAFEFSNPSGSLGTTALSARCNDHLNSGIYSSQSNTSLPTTLVPSGFRPQTQFANSSLVDIAQVVKIYTLEKVAVGYTPTPIDVLVKNVSTSAVTFDVIVTITDIGNTTTFYTSTETVTNLAPDSSTFVSFAGWNPTTTGDVIVTAETSAIPGENWLSNNTLSVNANVNTNTLSYTYDNSNPTAFGYNHPNSGLFLSKYTMKGSGIVSGANIVIPVYASTPGNTIYAVVLNSSGVVLSQSPNYVIQSDDMGTTKSFSFPTPPSFLNEDFFVGIAQTAGSTTWRPLGTFNENPRRVNTYYTANIGGGTLTELEAPFKLKFGIEAIVDLSVLSIEEYHLKDFTVYPNPVCEMLNLELTVNKFSQHIWNIYDINGKIILTGSNSLTSGKNSISIDTKHLSHGLYFLNSNIGGMLKTTKFIKR